MVWCDRAVQRWSRAAASGGGGCSITVSHTTEEAAHSAGHPQLRPSPAPATNNTQTSTLITPASQASPGIVVMVSSSLHHLGGCSEGDGVVVVLQVLRT